MYARLLLPFFLFLLGANGCTARTPNVPPADPPTREELEQIVAPIALYPDPLIQRILTASTFPDQIIDAAIFIEHGGAPNEIHNQPWERSVPFIANYPSVLATLAEDIDDTIKLGNAFTDSPEQLRDCIQSFRQRARHYGNLTSTSYQTVIEEGSPGPTATIRIEPTDPNTIYVPTTTTVVYERRLDDAVSLWAPLTSFGLGVALATALDHDDVYYYGGPFYGPGFWYGGPIYRRWYDYRYDRWHHAYDYGRWHRNDPHYHDEWLKHRHDLGQRHAAWRDAHRTHTGGHRTGLGPSDGRASFRPPHSPSGRTGAGPLSSPRTTDHRGASHGRFTTDHANRASHGGHRASSPEGPGASRGGHGGRGR